MTKVVWEAPLLVEAICPVVIEGVGDSEVGPLPSPTSIVIAACAADAVGRILSASGGVVSHPRASRESEPLLNIVDAEGSGRNEGSNSRIEVTLTCSGRGSTVQCVSRGTFLNLNSN